MSNKINVVVVGYGGMGRYHANHIAEFEKFNLSGIYDIKEDFIFKNCFFKYRFTIASRTSALHFENLV